MKYPRLNRFLFLLFILVFSGHACFTQEEINPVNWSVDLVEENDTVKFIARAVIEPGWHVYSQVISDDPEAMGPMPLEMKLDTSEYYVPLGNPVEKSRMITHFDKAFGIDLNYYENELVVVQPLKIINLDGVVKGFISYMACDDEKCIFPPEYTFELKLGK